ncbi:DNA polymerase III subunit gamma/tau [Calothrix sp. NIES-4071]|nr:DNA polymerase III subunit gamma/tau [Calothrix sp. NIES-4071]BAZ61294.1 DNA polymerase III subunit gamma/tau [Calothrix sp. NIES-4105]
MSYEPLHHKYRPRSFAELVGQSAIATTLTNAINTSRIAPAYLFTGPRGTGKTSSARILAKSLNCLSSPQPTATPCGMCDVCLGISKGYTVDVIEIDAASNTGVENVRDIIEKAQFAPVQCRYKVYVIDECLTGDSLVLTSKGLVRIDNPKIKGHTVLSYNDFTRNWEYKTVVRWFDQGTRQTLVIKTTNREIRCTGNHLIRTELGWIRARDVKEGMKILSPANAVVAPSFTSISIWEQKALSNGWQTLENTQFPQWTTSLERVESVTVGKLERVYDIEVEDNHNFVANGLSVHNCHMLSTQAFNALLKTLEEPPKHIVFILATTDPQRVLPTIISRCQRFDFRRIDLDAMVSHLTDIAIKENINITTEAITLVAQLSQGGLRDAESLLDQLSLLPDQVNPSNVWDLVGTVSEHDLYWLFKAIATDDAEALIDTTRKILDRGREPLTILQNLAGFYRDLLIAKTAPNRNDLVACTQETWLNMVELVNHIDIYGILAGQQHLRNAEVQLKNTTNPRLWLEVTLLGLLPSAHKLVAPSTNMAPPERIQLTSQPHNNNSPTNGKAPFLSTNNHTAPKSQPANQQPVTDNPTAPATNNQPITHNPTAPATNNQPVTHNPTAPATNNQPVNNNQNNDLAETWLSVLSHLEPISRREMLRQMCNVIEIRSTVARLSVKQAWHKRVQEDLPIIRRAFQATFNREITVSIEVSSSASNRTKESGNTSTTEEPPPTVNVEPQTQKPVKVTSSNGNLTPQNENNFKNTTSYLSKENSQNNSVQNPVQNGSGSVNTPPKYTHEDNQVQQQPANETLPKSDVSNLSSNLIASLAPDVVEISATQEQAVAISSVDVEKVWYAAERLAQFFDGQIIGYNEDAAEFGDSAAPSDLMDVVEGDDE